VCADGSHKLRIWRTRGNTNSVVDDGQRQGDFRSEVQNPDESLALAAPVGSALALLTHWLVPS